MNIVNIGIGYFIFINILALALLWVDTRTVFWKQERKVKNIIYLLLSVLGAGFALLLGFEMFTDKEETKKIRSIIYLITFIEVCLLIYILVKNTNV